MKHLYVFILAILFLCCKSENKVQDGIWRAEVPTIEGILPFNIEIENGKAFVINADEKFEFDTLYYQNDSIHLELQLFDAEIIAKVNGDVLNGIFRKKMADLSNREGKFEARYNQSHRFEMGKKNPNLGGKYSVIFKDGESTYEAVGVFQQNEDRIKGTFLTTTGDYRYLDGNIVGDSLKLSCFDGNHIFLFKAKIQNDSLVGGTFCYNLLGVETWTGIKNENATLPDANSLTYLKPGYDKIAFSFPDYDGNLVSLNDERFNNRVTIVQILGTWCPNCMDETRFLVDFKKKNPEVEIVGLAFEKSLDMNFVKPKIDKLRTRFGVTYPILLAGLNDKADASSKFPMLNKIISFPTTIIIDKKGVVRRVHTGFTGPGTGEYYIKFVQDFNRFIEKLEGENT